MNNLLKIVNISNEFILRCFYSIKNLFHNIGVRKNCLFLSFNEHVYQITHVSYASTYHGHALSLHYFCSFKNVFINFLQSLAKSCRYIGNFECLISCLDHFSKSRKYSPQFNLILCINFWLVLFVNELNDSSNFPTSILNGTNHHIPYFLQV